MCASDRTLEKDGTTYLFYLALVSCLSLEILWLEHQIR